MTKPVLAITIDTEPDNVWGNGTTTKNSLFLPRFQEICESNALKPTYLVTHEMALDERFQLFAHDVLARETAEVGAHLHAWNSPPIDVNETRSTAHTYITELPENLARAKLQYLTNLLSELFGIKPKSFRAGRWGFNEMVARLLVELEYGVDCSVTPGVSWHTSKGALVGGPDYFGFRVSPYFLDLNDIRRPGSSRLLEVPVTICPAYPPSLMRLDHALEKQSALAAAAIHVLVGQSYLWLRPRPTFLRRGNMLSKMIHVVDWAIENHLPVIEFMMHSSELMPSGSPYFANEGDVNRLYYDLRSLFKYIQSREITGCTLSDCRDMICKSLSS
ncbi:MAG: deacetylase [Candidatus Bathyarchaeia archaeon]